MTNQDCEPEMYCIDIDLSDRTQAEVALRRSQQQLELAMRAANMGVWQWDVGTNDIIWTTETERVFGLEPGTFGGTLEAFVERLHPDDIKRVNLALQKALDEEEKFKIEYRSIFPDSTIHWIEAQGDVLRDDQGNPVFMIGVVKEISDRKAAEDKLRQNEQKYHQILDAISDMVLVKDPQFRMVWANKAFREYYGMSNDQLQGLIDAPFNKPDYTQQYIRDDAYVFETGKSLEVEEPATRYDGEVHIFNTIKSVIRNEAGENILLVAACRDVSDRKAMEAQLHENELFLRNIYEGSGQGICVVDVTESGDFRFTGWNPQLEKLTNVQSQVAIGQTPEELFGEAKGSEVRKNYQRCLATGTTISYEEFLPIEGRDIWWFTTLSPLRNEANQINRIILTVIDISDRKAAEVALKEYADRQTLLNLLVSQIRNSLDLDVVIATTIQSIRELLEIDACSFAWYHCDAESPAWEVVQEAKRPEIPSRLGFYPRTLVGPVDQMYSNQEILRIDEVKQYEEEIHRTFLDTIGCQSEILLPIKTHSQRLGVICCVHYRQVRPWTESEVELLKAVSDQLAIAIDQAELYAETQSKSQKLQQTLKELQRTQAQMVQAEKMSSLGQLVGGMAHEINNPVSFIHGNITPAEDYIQ
ncbi:MAG: PAS domain-containing protein, partial [Cyanobacteriota bacterium]|nr:PAS domain-containing protein [Cyanobacteriota bacterium]